MLWDQPTFAGIADDLEYFLRDAIFVAHNVAFDYNFIKAEYGRRGWLAPATRFINDVLLSAPSIVIGLFV